MVSSTSGGYMAEDRLFRLVFEYFWLIAIAVNSINAVIFWHRAQPHIAADSSLRPGYVGLVRGFFIYSSIPWVVMGAGLLNQHVSRLSDYFYPSSGNPWVIAWWVSLWCMILGITYWMLFRGGAIALIRHPGLINPALTDPTRVKQMWLFSLMISAGVTVFMVGQPPK